MKCFSIKYKQNDDFFPLYEILLSQMLCQSLSLIFHLSLGNPYYLKSLCFAKQGYQMIVEIQLRKACSWNGIGKHAGREVMWANKHGK